jgi:hypothetical protein
MLNIRIPKDVRPARRAIQLCFWAISLRTLGEWNFDDLVSSRLDTIPRPMESHVHACEVLVEDGI